MGKQANAQQSRCNGLKAVLGSMLEVLSGLFWLYVAVIAQMGKHAHN